MDSQGENVPFLSHQNTVNRQTYDSDKSLPSPLDKSAAKMDENDVTRARPTKGKTVSRFRQSLPQVLAVTVQSLQYLSMGMAIAFPAVVIPVVTEENTKSSLHFSVEEASWYGSLLYIMNPFGSLTAGALLQPIGCRNWMILLNIPLLASWLMAYYANSSTVLLASTALSGFVVGLIDPPTVRYASEVSQPSLRGVLITYASMFIPMGYFVIYLLAALTDWRHIALASALTPIVCMITLCFVPETPLWLMSKGRPGAALKSLRWLRGWTSADMVEEELNKLKFYSKNPSNETEIVNDSLLAGNTEYLSEKGHQQKDKGRFWGLMNKETLVPLAKCNILFILSIASGRNVIIPYQLEIFKQMNLPMDPNTIALMLSLVSMVGNMCCLVLVNRTGKKPLGIFSFTIDSICFCLLGVYLMLLTSSSVQHSSFLQWSAVALFTINTFTHNVGILPVMMTYLGEILPYRGRGVTTGIVKSVYCVAIFAGTNTFPAMELQLGLRVIFFMHAAVCVAGAFFVYFSLPKTDDLFLSDIEIELTHANDTVTAKNKM